MTEYSQQVPALARAVGLIEAVAAAPEGLAAGALEEVVDGSRSGLYALLNTLRNHAWLVQDTAGNYLIGPALRRIAPSADDDDTALSNAVAAALGSGSPPETVAVLRADGNQRLVVAQHLPERLVRCSWPPGSRRDDKGADAIVLQAATDPGLQAVRDAGMAQLDGDEAAELAAPVCRDGHTVDAVLLMGIPTQRATGDAVANARTHLRTLAAEVSLRLGAPTWQPWGATPAVDVGTSRRLGDAEIDDLLTDRFSAQLACLRDDGSPHVVPLWFDWDGDSLWLTASPGASWATYVADGARVSLTIEEPWPALRRVFVSGWAAPVTGDMVPGGGVEGLRRRLATQYIGPGVAASEGLGSPEGWTAIRVTPERVHGRAGLATVAA